MESDKFSFKITIVLCFLFVVFSFCIRRLPTQLPNAISRNLTEKSVFLLQHYLTAFGSTLSVPLVLQSAMCIGDDRVGLSEIISTIFFVSGLSTLLQTTFGVRHVNNILTSWNERHSDPQKKRKKKNDEFKVSCTAYGYPTSLSLSYGRYIARTYQTGITSLF